MEREKETKDEVLRRKARGEVERGREEGVNLVTCGQRVPGLRSFP